MKRSHSMPFGPRIIAPNHIEFRLWAPGAQQMELVYRQSDSETLIPMQNQDAGWKTCELKDIAADTVYGFRMQDGLTVPDPASRCQVDDVHGLSRLVDPTAFDWQDETWRGRPWEEAVFYELHAKAFNGQGFQGVLDKLDYLVDLGITAIELMPLSDFPGQRNWGYDGVLHFAPDTSYGTPEQLKTLIQTAHSKGLMVFLDVVYNHFGPEGNYLYCYAKNQFFNFDIKTPWGAAINYDGSEGKLVREFVIQNVLYWLEEYHLDGLRFDAVQEIHDRTHPHLLSEISQRVESHFADSQRHIHLVLEHDANESRYLRTGASQRYYNAQWNDDFHHAVHVLLSGEDSGYYADFATEPVKLLAKSLTEGYIYQGQGSPYRNGATRGEPSAHLPPTAFVNFLQNHDQTGNRAFGERLHHLTDDQALQAITALWLLAPQIPLFFMGQEWLADTPFLFFCDFGPDLAQAVTAGRREEFAKFEAFSDPSLRKDIPDPNELTTFQHSSLDWEELNQPDKKWWLELHKNLLTCRHQHIVPWLKQNPTIGCELTWLDQTAFSITWKGQGDSKLTLLANLGEEPAKVNAKLTGSLLYPFECEQMKIKKLSPWSAFITVQY